MAEAILEIVLHNLSSLLQKELGLFVGVDREMERLTSTLTAIKAVLEDAEEKQLTNRALKDWLRKLKDAAYSLDDILDEYATEALRLECQGKKVRGSCISPFVHPKHALFLFKIAKKMKGIRERLDEIAEERIKFHLRESVGERRTNQVIEWRQTTSIITQPQIYGREEDKKQIVNFLVGDASDSEDVSIYPIVGIGGLGKTTLAQLVFNDEGVVNYFELKIWVCVSEDFSLKRMSKAIIESACGHACEDLDLDPLQRRLQEVLRGKRYLIVLDDVWNDDQEKWDKLKYVLACGSKGASILVTTRLTMVASIMGTVFSHQLSMLSEDDCWELFRQRAFGQDSREQAELVAIGKEIVRKCKGVPLAAKALGSLLRFKGEAEDWVWIKESGIWSLPQGESSILPALRLSYLNLQPKLRHCFAYCALFPKDERMSKELVIQLWRANGFISSNGRSATMEDDGDRAWNELYRRSFFQDIETTEHTTWFKMHDLVHDLAQSVVEDECCFITSNNSATNLSKRTRHLSIDKSISSHLYQVKSLKTYMLLKYRYNSNHSHDLVMKCSFLRALVLGYQKEVPSSIGHLKHLRYLNLSCSFFKELPNSITTLWNLQILNLARCQYLQKLPSRLKCLKALQHLNLKGCKSLCSMAPEMGQLIRLRTLNIYIVEKQKGFLLTELGPLKLEEKLHIKHLERVTSVMDAKESNLGEKHLTHLLLSWERNEESRLQENVEQILESLQPQTQQLQTLGVGGYMGVQFPQWMANPSLTNLNQIQLIDCKNCLSLPPLWKLSSLKILKISNMNHVQYLDDEPCDGGVTRVFKALEILVLDKLPSLIRLSKEDGENMFSCLSKLRIDDCPNLCLPSLPSLIKLVVRNECLLDSIQNLQNLKYFWFLYNKNLTSIPDGFGRGLTCLKELYIWKQNKLEPLSKQVLQRLHSLKRLTIGCYPNFKLSPDFQYLTSLEVLNIACCPEVEGFPEALQHITTLQSLTLCDLPNLAFLPDWLGSLRFLESLVISKCPKLMSLPMSTQSLGSLKRLEIYSCPELEKRCVKETGEDWHKIAHIPSTVLEGNWSIALPDGFDFSYSGVDDTGV